MYHCDTASLAEFKKKKQKKEQTGETNGVGAFRGRLTLQPDRTTFEFLPIR